MKLGVIVIGSLLWDESKDRVTWREQSLNLDEKVQVYLPIRYGRCSNSRRDTYTMVFSNICYSKNYGLGKGWIFPAVTPINSFGDLIHEVKKMGLVEGFSDGISRPWGSVAIKFNPQKVNLDQIKEKWISFMSKKLVGSTLLKTKLKSEKGAITSEGLLNIKWPQLTKNLSFEFDFDFLITTVTKPTLGKKKRYPSVNEIVASMNESDYWEYFKNNRAHGICTFQDYRIQSLKKTKNSEKS